MMDMQPKVYIYIRFILFPIIFVADFFQNYFTKYFTPMNMGPVSTNKFKKFLKGCFKKDSFILDFGCGAGYFSTLFDPKKYVGIDINKSFINLAKSRYANYKFYNFDEKKLLKEYKNKINYILINNVIHHLNKNQLKENFLFIKNNCNENTTLIIIEPLMPKKILSFEFFMKVLDIGNYITNQNGYKNRLEKHLKINKAKVEKFSIGSTLILTCKFKR